MDVIVTHILNGIFHLVMGPNNFPSKIIKESTIVCWLPNKKTTLI